MKLNSKNVVLMVIFLILGTVISIQLRSIVSINADKASQSIDNINKLESELDIQKEAVRKLQEQVDKKEIKREEYRNNTIKNTNSSYLSSLKKQLDEVRFKSGLTDVKGNGVIITLDDAEARITDDMDTLIIHDMDIVKLLNELKKAGAQAISVNNERVVSITEQVCAGPTIRVNKRKYAAPFEIKAIGNKDDLYYNMESSEIVYLLLKDKIKVSIRRDDNMVIPKYRSIGNEFSGVEVLK